MEQTKLFHVAARSISNRFDYDTSSANASVMVEVAARRLAAKCFDGGQVLVSGWVSNATFIADGTSSFIQARHLQVRLRVQL